MHIKARPVSASTVRLITCLFRLCRAAEIVRSGVKGRGGARFVCKGEMTQKASAEFLHSSDCCIRLQLCCAFLLFLDPEGKWSPWDVKEIFRDDAKFVCQHEVFFPSVITVAFTFLTPLWLEATIFASFLGWCNSISSDPPLPSPPNQPTSND